MVVGEISLRTDLLIVGAGPGGYAAAFRAADLGLDVTLVDEREELGGVCLYEGCIPSKTLLYLSELIHDAGRVGKMGLSFSRPEIDLVALRKWKSTVVERLSAGLRGLSEKRNVQWLKARAVFESSNSVRLIGSDVAHIKFHSAIVATGSRPVIPQGIEGSPGGRIMDSTGALALEDIPPRLLIVGGGYIALELGQVYASLGSKVSLAVRSELLRGVDKDLVKPLAGRMKALCESIYLQTGIESLLENEDSVSVVLKDKDGNKIEEKFDRVLIAAGRSPVSDKLGLDNTGVKIDEKGFIEVSEEQRTAEPNIFAIGDVVKGPMLAHKAMRQGKIAAEIIAGKPSAFDVRAIPAVVYTDPQIAWCGLTENQARQQEIAVKVVRFPWSASGRATTMGLEEGMTKLILEPDTGRVLGAGIVGRGAEALIAENVLAIEMGALAEDLAFSIHPHPSLTETEAEAAEIFMGSSTHFIVR
ncbi:MAG: dihydrolipoyl dehydrogenase [Desulfobulbaceae bacterium]|nr:dihydrolipoyl dehydrogenase [Desulfobulbaceae bacterium]